jgi:hypothetical protein
MVVWLMLEFSVRQKLQFFGSTLDWKVKIHNGSA